MKKQVNNFLAGGIITIVGVVIVLIAIARWRNAPASGATPGQVPLAVADSTGSSPYQPAPLRAAAPMGPAESASPRPEDSSAPLATPPRPVVEPVELAEFSSWTDRYLTASPGDRAALAAEGARLAAARRPAFLKLIQTDPKRALAQAVPRVVRQDLPAAVTRHLERPVSVVGDLNVYLGTPSPDAPLPKQGLAVRYVDAAGMRYLAHVDGELAYVMSKHGVPLRGVAMDFDLAVAENAVRPLEIGERIPEGAVVESACPACAATVEPVIAGLAVTADTPVVEIGERLMRVCNSAHATALENDYRTFVQAKGNGGAGFFLENFPGSAARVSIGSLRVLYMRVTYPDQMTPPCTEEEASEEMAGNSRFLLWSSFGKLVQTVTVTPLLVMPHTLQAYVDSYDLGSLQTDARNAARAMGYDPDQFDIKIVRAVTGPWGAAGWGGGDSVWLYSGGTSVLNHEVGHSLGLGHSAFWRSLDGTPYGEGEDEAYGNGFDVMGSGSGYGAHYTASSKWALGWLTDDYIHQPKANGVYRIYAYDQPSLEVGKRYMIRVEKDSQRQYNVEYHPAQVEGQALVVTTGAGCQLLDITPETPDTKDGIAIGSTYADPQAGVYFTVLSMNATVPPSLDIMYNRGPFLTNVAPTTTLSASATNVAKGGSVTFTATAADGNGDALAYHWECSDGMTEANSATFTRSFLQDAQVTVMVTVSDMKGGTARRSVVINAGSPPAQTISGLILTSSGMPLQGVYIRGGGTACYTDVDGTYRLAGVEAGSWQLTAWLAGYSFTPSGFSNPLTVSTSPQTANWMASPATAFVNLTKVADATEGGANGIFRFTRTGSTASNLTVRVSPPSGTAVIDQDYALTPAYGNVTGPYLEWFKYWVIPAGKTNLDVSVSAIDDTLVEGPETVILQMAGGPGYLSQTSRAVMTIFDNDTTLPLVSVSATDSNAAEGGGGDTGTFVFARTGPTNSALNVKVGWVGRAKNGTDYSLVSASGTSLGLLAPMIGNFSFEDYEALTHGIWGGVVSPTDSKAIWTFSSYNTDQCGISRNSPDPWFVPQAPDGVSGGYMQGNSGISQSITFSSAGTYTVSFSGVGRASYGSRDLTVKIDNTTVLFVPAAGLSTDMWQAKTSNPFTVAAGQHTLSFSTSGTTGDSDAIDGVTINDTVTIPAGQSSVEVRVAPIDDSLSEGPENVIAFISGDPSYAVGTTGASAEILITDDDVPVVTVTTPDPTAAEGADTGMFLITRTGSTAAPLKVYYGVAGSALYGTDYAILNGTDYTVLNGEVTIPASTNSVPVIISPYDNGAGELLESVTLVLATFNNAYSVGDPGQGTITIADNAHTPLLSVRAGVTGAEPGTAATFIVHAIGSGPRTITVNYTVSGTATPGSDYTALPGTLNINVNGSSDTVIRVPVLDNTLVEGTETVRIQLTPSPDYRVYDDGTAEVAILDNDSGSTRVMVSTWPGDSPSEAGLATGRFYVTRNNTTGDLPVNFALSGTATYGVDYTLAPASPVTITNGAQGAFVTMTPIDDALPEGTETVTITLLPGTGYSVDRPGSATYVIADNYTSTATVGFASTTLATTEQPGALGEFRDLAVNLSRTSTNTITVNYQAGGGTATGDDVDWAFADATQGNAIIPGGTLTFTPGVTNQKIRIRIKNDGVRENAETAIVQLFDPVNASITSGRGQQTITISDPAVIPQTVSFQVAATTRFERDGSQPISVVLDHPAVSTVTVQYTVSGSAVNGLDYNLAPGTLTFTAGQQSKSIPLTLLTDALPEAPETIVVTLINAVGATIVSPASHTITLVDDAAPVVDPLYVIASSSQPAGTLLGTVTGTPAAGRSIVSWSILSGNPVGSFAIDNSGNVTLAVPSRLPDQVGLKFVVRATDNLGAAADGVVYVVSNPDPQAVLEERWTTGYLYIVGDFSSAPNYTGRLGTLTSPENPGTDATRRMTVFLRPAVSGNYTFWAAANTHCRVTLSSNHEQANGARIITMAGPSLFQSWDENATQVSASIPLVAGKIYRLEVQHMEGGDDHVSVAWSGPGIARQPIPASVLVPAVNFTEGTPGVELLTFGLPGIPGVIDPVAKTISLSVPAGTDVWNLAPTYTKSYGATCSKASGSVQDFSSPVHYVVTSWDAAIVNDYVVTVTIAPVFFTTTPLAYDSAATGAEILNNGKLVRAYHFGNVDAATTVHGVTFQNGGDGYLDSAIAGDLSSAGGPWIYTDIANTAYQNLINYAFFSTGDFTLTISGLTIGRIYRLQTIWNNPRNGTIIVEGAYADPFLTGAGVGTIPPMTHTAIWVANDTTMNMAFDPVAGLASPHFSGYALHDITPVATTTTLASSLGAASAYGSVTFTATVTAGATGMVTFRDGATVLGSGTLAAGQATFTTNSLAVGGHSITATYPGDSIYTASASSPFNYAVSAKSVTITGVTAANKVYDGNPTAVLTGGAVSGVVNGDTVTVVAGTGNFANPNVGTSSVTATGYALGGTHAGNYALSAQPSVVNADITARPVQLAGNRVYDGTATVAASILAIGNKVGGDDLTLTGSANLAAKNAGAQAISTIAPAARVQSNTGSTSGANSFTVTLSDAPINGNTLVAVITTRRTNSTSAVSSINARGGVTWVRATQSIGTAGSTTEIWYAPNVQGAAAGVMINLAASNFAAVAVVAEYRGVLTASPLDASAANNGATSPASTGTTATTAQANELWIGGIGFRGGIGYTYTVNLGSLTSFANAQSGATSTSDKVYALDYFATATGTASSGGTLGAATTWSGAIATFKTVTPTTLGLTGTAAGNYTLAGVIGSVTITPAAAVITLGNLARIYDGTPRTVSATTDPAGLAVDLTYDGSPTAPSAAGSYAVVATLNEVNYVGSASGTLVITADAMTSWRNSHFTPAEITAGLAADGTDPDGDGFTNLEEYAYGTDPRGFTPQLMIITPAVGNHFTLSFLARSAAGSGYAGLTRKYDVESSTDPANPAAWLGVPGYFSIPGDDTTVDITLAIDAPRKFYRLNVRVE